MRVVDLMASDVISVRPETTLRDAARLMVEKGISGLPVTNEEGTLVGVVSEGDFLRKEVDRGDLMGRGLLGVLFDNRDSLAEAETVGEVMAENLFTVSPDATLVEAARTMTTHGVKRLPVVTREGKLVGVISRRDVVAAFTRPDELIEDEIREDILRRLLFLDPALLEISVDAGVVSIGGELPTRTDTRLLEAMVQRTDGVIRAEIDVTWKVDDTQAGNEPSNLP
ncbi:MAG: CBS domain-containing protein [Acidimicrobiia bacterium]|nr:CBS domain-containing protein [Acidimicrobiia bacterium]MBT8194018.1 CBS domain-containing protein [Acidimicrobiia bacterium]MBT8246743.1 CBS domain-containing protein [Acidimicrobiia bacterium]NNF88537.1 CBS domain-containing protein [Acidimicrobiia bacterium]NNJ48010.1 CBS domain-containing protein [Acidimicrobiia bacterium]